MGLNDEEQDGTKKPTARLRWTHAGKLIDKQGAETDQMKLGA